LMPWAAAGSEMLELRSHPSPGLPLKGSGNTNLCACPSGPGSRVAGRLRIHGTAGRLSSRPRTAAAAP
jgi:hypothetical protein